MGGFVVFASFGLFPVAGERFSASVAAFHSLSLKARAFTSFQRHCSRPSRSRHLNPEQQRRSPRSTSTAHDKIDISRYVESSLRDRMLTDDPMVDSQQNSVASISRGVGLHMKSFSDAAASWNLFSDLYRQTGVPARKTFRHLSRPQLRSQLSHNSRKRTRYNRMYL